MSRRKIFRKNMLSSCNELGPDDGRDPRLDRREGSGQVPNRKALQLCAQVARTLACALGECGDDVLRDLAIESVVPAPNTSRLLVTVSALETVDTRQTIEHLERVRGKLRSEAATAINRRRTPDLVFRVVNRLG